MQKQIFYLFVLLFPAISLTLLPTINASAQKKANGQTFITVQGIVRDTLNNAPLVGASIYFPDLKKGTVTNAKGEYQISIKPGKYIIEVGFIGFSNFTKNILFDKNTELNIVLNHTAVEAGNVMVTSFLRAMSSKRTSTPINILKKEDLFKGSGTNLIDALSKTPGVSQLSTGPAISKPIIRGLGYNRVMVLNDGVKQEGQQWGDEHGIEIDEYNVSRIEVLKVPASIIYGSEALSGVINIVSNVPVVEGAIRGNVFTNYQSNNQLQGYHFDIAGNKNGFVWGVNGSTKHAMDYHNKYDGDVFNSKYSELDGSVFGGIEKDWGYSHFFISEFKQKIGMIDGGRDSLGNFTHQVNVNGNIIDRTVTSADENAYNPNIPYQIVEHTKYTWDNSIQWGTGRLKANVAYQRNQRKEFGNILDPNEKSLYFDLGTLNYSFQYLLPEMNNWKHTIGVNGMQQQNLNKGTSTLIPEYKSTEAGIFFFTQKRMDQLTLNGGARIDQKGVQFDHMVNGTKTHEAKEFGDIAASFGMTYEAKDNWVYKLNIARGYRAPNMSELGSNGAHEGTNRYEYGNTNLRSEKSLQVDLGTEWSNEHVSFNANVFYNMVSNYIYYEKIGSALKGDSIIIKDDQKFYAFAYKQQDAHLYGVECNLDFHPHPLDGLHIENTLSYVKGEFNHAVDGSQNLPFIPPFRWLSELKYEFSKVAGGASAQKNNYVSLQFDNVSAQNNPFTGYNTETSTPGYTLINVGMGTHILHKGKQLCSLSLVAQNIGDIAYQNNMSRLKYLDQNPATGRMGVYNMGRNFSLKLNVPLVFD